MELLLWLQTIAFFAQVFDMARAQLGFSTWILVISEMLNLSDSHSIFYIFNCHLIFTFCKDYNQPSFIIEGKLRQKFPVQNHLHSWRNHKIMHILSCGYTSIQKFVLITLCPICTDFQAPYLPLHTGAWWSHITYRLLILLHTTFDLDSNSISKVLVTITRLVRTTNSIYIRTVSYYYCPLSTLLI